MEERLKEAKQLTASIKADSITIVPGEYYQRSKLFTYFFGEKNRALWTVPLTVKVFNYDSAGLQPFEIGGSQQTISIRLRDSLKREWTLRSVNKDQRNVLPGILRPTFLRSMFRDQVAAMNPFAPLITADLAKSAGLPVLHPTMYWVPHVEKHSKYNERMAGRVVYLEEHLNESWKGDTAFFSLLDAMDTDDMFERTEKEKTPLDTFLYLKTRLFDMLINDWDRHEDQWRWVLVSDSTSKKFIPIAKDRDNAFYVFDEGVISDIVLWFNNKFQSYRKDFEDIEGLAHQSKKLDKKILGKLAQYKFVQAANELQQQLSTAEIHDAFMNYPSDVYKKVGEQHKAILQSRLSQLSNAAKEFHKLISKDQD